MKALRIALILIFLAFLILSGCARGPKMEIPNQELDEGETLALNLPGFVEKGADESHTFAIVSGTGFIRGTQYVFSPDYGDAGEYKVIIQARDSKGRTSDSTFGLVVRKVNTPPVVEVPDQTVPVGEEVIVDLLQYVTDAEGDEVVLSLKDGLGAISEGRFFEYTADPADFGVHTVHLIAEDHRGASSEGAFVLNVEAPRVLFSISDKQVAANEKLAVELTKYLEGSAVRPDRFVKLKGPGDIDQNGVFMLNAEQVDEGEHAIEISAQWDYGLEASTEFSIVVFSRPAPRVSIPPLITVETDDYSVNLEQFFENLDLLDEMSFSLRDGPGLIEEGNVYVLPAHSVAPGMYKLTLEITSYQERKLVESAVRVVPSGRDEGSVLTVSKAGDSAFESIQKALDAARPGDVVYVRAGEYVENLQITKAVTLWGESPDKVIIRPQNVDGASIVVRANGFEIFGITVDASGRGIQLSASSGVLSNSRVIAGRPGVTFIGTGGNFVVRDSVLSSYGETEAQGEILSRLVALHAYGSGNVTIENSVFERCGTGILLGNSIEFSIINNLFRENQIAVSVTGSSTGVFKGNHVTGSFENGLLINTASEITVSDNLFYSNKLQGLDLYLRQCTVCRCGGTVFRGTVLGSGNVFDHKDAICPVDYNWPEDFYTVDRDLTQRSELAAEN